jgi:hypothetical protein
MAVLHPVRLVVVLVEAVVLVQWVVMELLLLVVPVVLDWHHQ